MTQPSPLRFEPILKRYVWGGRRLATLLGKPLAPDEHCAESWEVCDLGTDQSRVAAGPLAGRTLGELVRDWGRELLGRHHPQPQFPLLFKFLDTDSALSVQVHPDDERAARLDPPQLGKSEAWVVLAAEPDSVIYAGLKRGFDRAALVREVARGTCELCLHRIEPRPGDCVYLPAGTVHALGAGLLVAEIQQSSDVTWRLFDWNRPGPDGKPRELHVREALDAIDYGLGPIDVQMSQPAGQPGRERLVTCDKFLLDRWRLDAPADLGGDGRFHIIAVLSGQAELAGDPAAAPLAIGQTALLPAASGPTQIVPNGPVELLDAYLP